MRPTPYRGLYLPCPTPPAVSGSSLVAGGFIINTYHHRAAGRVMVPFLLPSLIVQQDGGPEMEIEITESIDVADGVHTGVVSRIEYRTTEQGYKYADIYIKEETTQLELKYGCPQTVSEKSKLGKLLFQFVPLPPKTKVDPDKVLIGKPVKFMTMKETTQQGKFVRIVDGSVSPIVKTENVV